MLYECEKHFNAQSIFKQVLAVENELFLIYTFMTHDSIQCIAKLLPWKDFVDGGQVQSSFGMEVIGKAESL